MPFLSLRSLIYCPSLVLSTKLWFEISSTMKCTICLSGSIQRSFKVNPQCHIVSYAAIRSIKTAQAVSLASKQSSVSCVSSVTRSTVDHSLWKPACSCGSWGLLLCNEAIDSVSSFSTGVCEINRLNCLYPTLLTFLHPSPWSDLSLLIDWPWPLKFHFVKFHPEVASCLLSRGKRKYAPLGMRLLWKYIRNYFLVYQWPSHFCHISKTTKNLKLKFWICN